MGLILALAAGAAGIEAGPSRFGFSDRVERHMFPEVTTGPAEPSWSPDGRWLVFSMQGDLWKIQAAGGQAVALTSGPWYYFEPTWSPAGDRIAFTVDTGGNLDVGTVSTDGGPVARLTDDRAVDLQPVWGAGGRHLYFVSSRNGGFDIFRMDADGRSVVSVVAGGGNQIQPAVSPDGRTLAYVSAVRGRLGTGGIWTQPLDVPDAEPTLVHYEESEYRVRPRWTPDGHAFLYGSDETGSNDIASVPVSGGNPIVLTNAPTGEFSAAPSPDGGSFAFISNRTGPMTLYVSPMAGGPVPSWRPVPVTSLQAVRPTGRLRGRVVDGSGTAVPARIQLVASDGRAYAPARGFARVIAVSETHYFHTPGEFEVEVPAGPVQIEALRGFEFQPTAADIAVEAGEVSTVTLTLERLASPPDAGWYSGDTHAHDLHQGRFGLSHRTLFEQSLAEDLHVSNVLIHMDGTRLMGRWEDLTGEPHPLSTPTHILQFAQEFRGSLGHVGLLGINRYVLPLVGGARGTPYAETASDLPYVDGAHAQGGIAGFMHPYLSGGDRPGAWAGSLIPVDVALGRGDFYDIASLYSDELASAEMYYRLLNCGFRLPATGGTDNFPDVWRDPPPGTDRTYALVDGVLSAPAWLDAVKAGRTFATNGPLVFLTVDGREPGGEVRLSGSASPTVAVDVRVSSIAPVERLDILVNGSVVESVGAAGPDATSLAFTGAVPVPDGGWIAARVIGPPSRYIADSYAFAHTSPVYVIRDGQPFVSPADATFLTEVVDAVWARADRSPWRTDADRDAFKREVDDARAVYLELAGRR